MSDQESGGVFFVPDPEHLPLVERAVFLGHMFVDMGMVAFLAGPSPLTDEAAVVESSLASLLICGIMAGADSPELVAILRQASPELASRTGELIKFMLTGESR